MRRCLFENEFYMVSISKIKYIQKFVTKVLTVQKFVNNVPKKVQLVFVDCEYSLNDCICETFDLLVCVSWWDRNKNMFDTAFKSTRRLEMSIINKPEKVIQKKIMIKRINLKYA